MPASSVMAAPGTAKSASRLAAFGFVRPRIVSTHFTAAASYPAALVPHGALQLGQLGEALLEGRVGGEQRRDREPRRHRRREKECIKSFGGPQVPGGDLTHGPR